MIKHLKPITKNSLKKIFDQMTNSLFTINEEEIECDIGFFCYIRIENNNIPIMIINKIYDLDKFSNKILNININNNKKKIELGNVIVKNKEYDIMLIEVKENEKDNIYFTEIDDKLYLENPERNYYNESIYILHYDKLNDISVSYNLINDINNSKLIYTRNINSYSKGSPIMNLSNNKLIGIHEQRKNYNEGIFIKSLIDDFANKYKYKNKLKLKNEIYQNMENEIEITINVKKEDTFKEIYFLDNYKNKESNENNDEESNDNENKDYKEDNKEDDSENDNEDDNEDDNEEDNEDDNEKDDEDDDVDLNKLNESNTKLVIDNKINKYQKYFIPEKEGNYKINLKFNIKLTDCSYMFANCNNITNINFIHFDTSNIKNMKAMFHNCKNLKFINLFTFDTQNVTDMSDMFSFCENLKTIDIYFFDLKEVSDMSYMFYHCSNLENLYINPKSPALFPNVDYIFHKCKKLTNPELQDVESADFEAINKYTNQIIISINAFSEKKYYFINNSKELNESNTELYINDKKLKYQNYFIAEKSDEYLIKLIFTIDLTDCSDMFTNCNNINEIKFISFNTKQVKNMKNMFRGCYALKNLNLSNFNTKKVIDMSGMFCLCGNLKNIDLSSFDTKKVKTMNSMFSQCGNLETLDLSSFNTKNVIDMAGMFSGCDKLISLNLSTFDTKNVTNMSSMFDGCRNLVNLNISSFNTEKVEDMGDIFYGCDNLILGPEFEGLIPPKFLNDFQKFDEDENQFE